MPDADVKKLLDPTGPHVQEAVKGSRIAARVAVAVYWEEIEKALEDGLSITAIYNVLHKAGVLSVTLQAFTRQVKARREGKGVLSAATKPANDGATSPAAGAQGPNAETPSPAPWLEGADEAVRPAHNPWRRGAHVPPDPSRVFKPSKP